MRTTLITLTSIAFISFTAIAADKKPDISKLPAPSDKKDVTYAKDIKPILEKSCFACHGPEKQKAEFRVDSLEAAIKGGESGKPAVVPGKSAESPIVISVADLLEDYEMPPLDKREKYPALTKGQVALLRAWIDQGAK